MIFNNASVVLRQAFNDALAQAPRARWTSLALSFGVVGAICTYYFTALIGPTWVAVTLAGLVGWGICFGVEHWGVPNRRALVPPRVLETLVQRVDTLGDSTISQTVRDVLAGAMAARGEPLRFRILVEVRRAVMNLVREPVQEFERLAKSETLRAQQEVVATAPITAAVSSVRAGDHSIDASSASQRSDA